MLRQAIKITPTHPEQTTQTGKPLKGPGDTLEARLSTLLTGGETTDLSAELSRSLARQECAYSYMLDIAQGCRDERASTDISVVMDKNRVETSRTRLFHLLGLE